MTKTLIIKSHPRSGWSMIRYSNILERIYKLANIEYISATPTTKISDLIKNKKAKKFAIYFEKYPIFFIKIIYLQIRYRFSHTHFADHSDSLTSLAISKNIKKFVTVHDQFAILAAEGEYKEVKIRLSGKIYQYINRFLLSRFDKLLCVSHETQKTVWVLHPEVETRIFHNPIDSIFNISKVSSTEKFKRFHKYFLVVNNSHWRKNRIGSLKVWLELRKIDLYSIS